MSGTIAIEAKLNGIIREVLFNQLKQFNKFLVSTFIKYLEHYGYQNTLEKLNEECIQKGKPFDDYSISQKSKKIAVYLFTNYHFT